MYIYIHTQARPSGAARRSLDARRAPGSSETGGLATCIHMLFITHTYIYIYIYVWSLLFTLVVMPWSGASLRRRFAVAPRRPPLSGLRRRPAEARRVPVPGEVQRQGAALGGKQKGGAGHSGRTGPSVAVDRGTGEPLVGPIRARMPSAPIRRRWR